MHALQLTAWKSPPELREVPTPEPGPGEVLVRVGAAGACHSDLHLIHDFEPGILPFDLPFTLGHENAGWVDALGPGVDGLEVGTPVAVYGPWGCGRCWRCQQGNENYCERASEIGAAGGGLGRDGGMAPYMLVPSARLLVPLGDGLDLVQAAPLTDAGLTPYHAIKRSLHLLGAGSTAVVIGTGGLGHLAVQILRAISGAQIIAVDLREEARRLALDVGADHALPSDTSAADTIRDLTGGLGTDVALDFVGVDPTIALAASACRPMGHATVIGIGGGSFGFSFFSQPYEVSLATTYWGSRPELIELLELARRGSVRAHVEQHPLDEAPVVYEKLHAGEVSGRAVIVP
ncbi:MAG TPA: NAD(P)-dependent alcohol dehydrogenase [Acidimicrobiales bacterium]